MIRKFDVYLEGAYCLSVRAQSEQEARRTACEATGCDYDDAALELFEVFE
ncbi:hypothetical protein [Pseudomonas sp. PA15(2017)]|nr:hypothetical protein [Pseudomonas sp. PA15(2017)]